MTSRWVSASRTTPFLPTFSRPASNWGFTRQTPAAWSAVTARATGKMCFREMKETSTLKNSTGSASWSGVTLRMLVRSMFTTRSSVRSFQASWP